MSTPATIAFVSSIGWRKLLAGPVALAMTLVSVPASANGKFPAAGQIVVDPGDPTHILVRTTFGILVSRDHGKSFDLICEAGAGYAGNVDPGIAVTAGGTILAGIAEGIDIGEGDACAWKLAGGPPAGQSILDVSVLKGQPTAAVALSVSGGQNSVFRSDDAGQSWQQAGSPLPAFFQGITLDVAPSDPGRIYVSGLDKASGLSAALARSDDSGVTWTVAGIAMAQSRAPYLSAIDPNDPDRVYIRLDGTPGTLLVTGDGGASYKSLLTLPGYMQGFALSPDGATVLAGGPSDGLWRAPSASYDFKRVKADGVQCLSWSGDEVYSCGTSVAVSRSTDQGDSFDPLLQLECIRGPLPCDIATPVGKLCPAAWEDLKSKLPTQYCAEDGGAAGAGSSSGGTEAAAGGTSGAAGSPARGGGCGCRAAPEEEGAGVALVLLQAAWLIRRRARRAVQDNGRPVT